MNGFIGVGNLVRMELGFFMVGGLGEILYLIV